MDQLHEKFNRNVDATTARLVESYRMLLRKGVIEDSVEPQAELQMDTAVSNIAFHTQNLLNQINELRMQIIMQKSKNAENVGEDQDRNEMHIDSSSV